MHLHDSQPAQGAAGDPPAAALPIIGHFAVEIGEDEQRRLERLAKDLSAREPALSELAAFGPDVRCGLGPGPKLVIEDHSAIALFEEAGDAAYAYRALLLAGEGDIAIAGARRSAAFEAYCRDHLGLGNVEVLVPAASNHFVPLAVRCRDDARLLARVATLARRQGALNILPYMGTGGVWSLAGAIAAEAQVPVQVATAPPRLTRRVNDKIWFAARLPTVAIKLPDSASSAGNLVFDAAALVGCRLTDVRDQVLAVLHRAGWGDSFPLMVTAWEAPLLASPSVQVWVPGREQGPPIVEGIFEQMLAGTGRAFVGARPSRLSAALQQQLAEQAARLATLFQLLGYFGRCSFDLILVGSSERDVAVHWIECNGRWGGVSIPMTLANRLVGDWWQHPFVICERSDLNEKPRDLPRVLKALESDLFTPRRDARGAVILSPSRLEEGSGFEIMVFGPSAEAAAKRAAIITALLSGAGPAA